MIQYDDAQKLFLTRQPVIQIENCFCASGSAVVGVCNFLRGFYTVSTSLFFGNCSSYKQLVFILFRKWLLLYILNQLLKKNHAAEEKEKQNFLFSCKKYFFTFYYDLPLLGCYVDTSNFGWMFQILFNLACLFCGILCVIYISASTFLCLII